MARKKRENQWEIRPIVVEASDYAVRGPAVIKDGIVDFADYDTLEIYNWTDAESLPYELAAIRDEADILGCVRRWGLLGTQAESPEISMPEPLEDWWQAARSMNFMLYLYALVDKYERGTLGSRREVAEFWAGVFSAKVNWSWLAKPDEREQMLDMRIEAIQERADLDVLVEDIRTEILEEELWDLENQRAKLSLRRTDTVAEMLGAEVRDMPPGNYVLTILCEDLLARAWIQLAMEVTRGVPAEICPVDGRVFAVRDPRQRYCSPQCAGRARYRRFAEKKKGGRK